MEVSEFYWKMVSVISAVLEICILSLFFYRFVKPFITVKKYAKLAGAVYGAVTLILYMFPEPLGGSVTSAISSAAAVIVMYKKDKRNMEQKIFLSVVFYLLERISGGMAVAVYDTLADLLIMIPAVYKSYVLQFWVHTVLLILRTAFEYMFMYILIWILHAAYKCKTENMTKGELVLMLAPNLSLVEGGLLIRYFVNTYETDLKQYIWNNHYSYNVILFLHHALSFAAMLTVIIIYQGIKESKRRETQEAILERQVEDMRRHISEVEGLYRDIRGMKHDMANHALVLERLYAENDEAKEYTARLKEQMCDTMLSGTVKSGNPITDVILMEKHREASEKGIAFESKFYYPENAGLNTFDVSIILNNALDNAIEAARECDEPYIGISSYIRNNAYVIEIRNSIQCKRTIDEESGLPVTTKTDGMHGFGLSNIRNVALKYYGDIDIEQEEAGFRLTVMLMLK